MTDLIARMEEWPGRRFALAAAAAIGLPLVATIAAVGAVDVVLVGLSAAAAAATGWLGWRRHQLAGLPLEISRRALCGEVGGRPVYRFRVRLGRGRRMRGARSEVVFRDEHGVETRLEPVIADADVLLGPWTLVVEDPEDRCARPGTFHVRVFAEEGARHWECEASWSREAVRPGRFGAGMRLDGGRLRWDHESWDQVVEAGWGELGVLPPEPPR